MSLFNKLAQQERAFYEKEFIAPVTVNKYTKSSIKVKIDGIIVQLLAPEYNGFGIWKPKNANEAILVREASLSERYEYLSLFPKYTIMVTDNEIGAGFLVYSDGRLKADGEIPIRLLNNAEQFDCIQAAFDGNNFWYFEHNYRISGITIQELRNCLTININPKQLPLVGLTDGIKCAYEFLWRKKQRQLIKKSEDKIESAVNRAGAKFISQRKQGEDYRVTYDIDGQEYTSTINKNLGVISAGICLSGGDREFDLQTLVTTVRLGQNSNRIHRW